MEASDNPYQSPNFSENDATQGELKSAAAPYQSTQGLAFAVMGLLAICGIVDLLGAGSSYLQIDLLQRVAGGYPMTTEEANANDMREGIIGSAQLLMLIITAIPFLIWMYRSYRNLPALGATRLQYSAGWAAGAWFVPILNLFRPYQITQEIWKHSDPENLKSKFAPRGSALVGWWWAFWICSAISGQISFRLAMQGDGLEQLILSSWAGMISSAISVPLALAAIFVVRGINANQQQRYEQMTFGKSDVSAFPPYPQQTF